MGIAVGTLRRPNYYSSVSMGALAHGYVNSLKDLEAILSNDLPVNRDERFDSYMC